MKKKPKTHGAERSAGGFSHTSPSTEFYSASPTERPLSDEGRAPDSHSVRKTGRHQAVSERREDRMDPREKMALMAIFKSAIMVLSLVIAFFMLRKGISLYEESIWLEHTGAPAASPVMQEVNLVENFDIQDQDSRKQFAERIEQWKEADRLVRSADTLLQRKNYDQAIEQCQEALRRDPAHRGALERLGKLYYAKGDHVEAVNAYIRLLSVDPAREKTQKWLIEALDAFGDPDAVKYMAEWYLEQNVYDADVQRYLANALYAREDFEAAAEAYGRVLRESPLDWRTMAQQASAYMQVEQYEKALVPLAKLYENDYENPIYYKQIAICNAQLQRSHKTIQILLRAAEVFGQQLALGLIQDPQLDPVREDRAFQAFVDRVGGKEFRLELEELARRTEIKGKHQAGIDPLLEKPVLRQEKDDLLKPQGR